MQPLVPQSSAPLSAAAQSSGKALTDPPFSTSPAVYASFSEQARALLDGLLLVAEDPELAAFEALAEAPGQALPSIVNLVAHLAQPRLSA